ncbi:MAG: hypothetical protein COB83_13035 [Gammaproteobacteria bacterium]|nr:MAG: hypothetical protein COB83_13035 [Gammaproteobacteria bacterium]
MEYKVIDDSEIQLSNTSVTIEQLIKAVKQTNDKFEKIYHQTSKMNLNLFDVIDFRVLSGVVGETFVTEMCLVNPHFKKNPSLDGYPDLLQVSTPEMQRYFETCDDSGYIKFKFGGLEVKNTFGTKKSKSFLMKGDTRVGNIGKKLDWKAHHQDTNYLVALLTDYVDGVPQIASLFYSSELCVDDWNKKQDPKEGSAMTSFSTIGPTGFKKLKQGLKICLDDPIYIDFAK